MSLSTRMGLMSGFLSAILITFLYIADKSLLVNGYERLTFVCLGGSIIYAMLYQRKTVLSSWRIAELADASISNQAQNNEFSTFGELLKLGFRTYLIGYFIKFSFIWFLFNYYDTQLIELVKAAYLEIVERHKNSSEMEWIYQQNLEKFESENFGPSFKNILSFEIIVGFLISLVAAYFLKRERPDY